MPTYLADILAAHRARAGADGRALPDLVEQAAGHASAPGLPRRPGRSGPLLHRRDQATFAVQGRPRPWAPGRPGGQGLRHGRRLVPLGADRRRLLRRLRRRPGGRPPGLRPAGVAQGLHRAGGRRGRRPPHGSRRRPADRRRTVGRRAAGPAPRWPPSSGWPRWSRSTTRRSWRAPWTSVPAWSG